jgi:L-ascorbate metabolism protein UlaG (beta-lactamase superfamily)
MRRFGLSLALALIAATAALADEKPPLVIKKPDLDKGKLVIRWHGQSFFEITSSIGTKIVIDPHGLEQYRMNLKDEVMEADLLLVSHPHADHSNVAIVKDYKDPKKVKQIWGVDQMTREWNEAKEQTVKDVKVSIVKTFHDKVGGMSKGKNGVFVIEMDGLRLVHLGDLGHELSDKQLMGIRGQKKPDDPEKPVDILMIPIGGVYTMQGLDAMKVVEQINPKRNIIPMHYGTIVYDWLLDIKKSHFLDDIPAEKIETLKVNKLVIDPKAPAPKEAKFTILHFFDDSRKFE